MQVEDLPAVQALEARTARADARNPVFFRYALERTPHACSIIDDGGTAIGFCFTSETASVGALTLLLTPVGAATHACSLALIREATEALTSRCQCCLTHASSDAYEQCALLIQAGFHAVEPQYVLRAPSNPPRHDTARTRLPQQVAWSDVWAVAPQMAACQQAGFGTHVTVTGAAGVCGAALVEFTARRHGGGQTSALVSAGGAVRSLGAGPLLALLESARMAAHAGGRSQFFITLNGFYQRELAALLDDGWGIVRVLQRFILSTTLARYRQLQMQPAVDLGYWQL